MTTPPNQLKPCPFCGGAARPAKIGNGNANVYCINDDCWVQPELKSFSDPAMAIISWNTRAPTSTDEWMPIESAPRDKWLLLGYKNQLGNWRTVRGNWFSVHMIAEWEDFDGNPEDYEGWYETAENSDDLPNVWKINPTHWMPLPKPPTEVK